MYAHSFAAWPASGAALASSLSLSALEAAASIFALYVSGSAESECPPSNQQMAPALPPVSTQPRAAASLSIVSTPKCTHRSTAKSVLPPETTTMSPPRKSASSVSREQSSLSSVTSTLVTVHPSSAKRTVCLSNPAAMS